jgi:hypothetical protein
MKQSRALGFVLSASIVLAACEGTIGGGSGGGGDDGPSSGGSPGGGGLNTNNGPGVFGDGVTVHLVKLIDGTGTVSFGVPVPNGVNLTDVSTVRVTRSGTLINASAKEVLATHDNKGARTGVQSFVVQFPTSEMPDKEADVSVIWRAETGAAPSSNLTQFGADAVSWASVETITTATRTISAAGGTNALVESAQSKKTLFTAREPRVLATYPDGFLAQTGILGHQVTVADAAKPERAGLTYLSKAFANFTQSAIYAENYALNPDPESVVDPVANYEGWLYDRCATFLTAYAHTNDAKTLRAALRSCSYYASKITLSGTSRGIFSGKASPDSKYSHLRGLYAYYALTGDEVALAAGTAIAELWLGDADFAVPYAAGRIRAKDKLWTERLLGTSLEGLYYGARLTGEVKYVNQFSKMFETAYRHITGDAATLAAINPGLARPLPPQNCFVHTAEQQAEGTADQPWCSTWMSELTIDALLKYQELTGDDRVDEVFIRLARFLRDVGTSYMKGDILRDTFLAPSVCDSPSDGEGRRMLVPLYGSGIAADGTRQAFGEYSDYEHCSDATALTAAALRALKHQGTYDKNAIGPFKSEGASLLQLHHELSSCAARTFDMQTRPRRDPAVWTSKDLAAGLSDPAAFIRTQKIGYPKFNASPQRKYSWWFNVSMLQFGLLAEAGIEIPALSPGAIQPAGKTCK